MLKAIMPTPDEEWLPEHKKPGGGGVHFDGYGASWPANVQVGCTLYLHDVRLRGGCFCLWPRQHHRLHEHFRANPSQIDGSFQLTPDFKELGWRALYETTEEPAVREFQFVGKAGSALFWHGAFTGIVSSFAKRKK